MTVTKRSGVMQHQLKILRVLLSLQAAGKRTRSHDSSLDDMSDPTAGSNNDHLVPIDPTSIVEDAPGHDDEDNDNQADDDEAVVHNGDKFLALLV